MIRLADASDLSFTEAIASARGCSGRVVYVDSGSSDGSVELARSLGVAVVELDFVRSGLRRRGRGMRGSVFDGVGFWD